MTIINSIANFDEYSSCNIYVGWLVPITALYPFINCCLNGYMKYYIINNDLENT